MRSLHLTLNHLIQSLNLPVGFHEEPFELLHPRVLYSSLHIQHSLLFGDQLTL
jgi:hypothetical protein